MTIVAIPSNSAALSVKQPLQYIFYIFLIYIVLDGAGTLCGLLEVSAVERFRCTVQDVYVW